MESAIAKHTKAAEGCEQGSEYGCQHYRRKCQFVTPCCNKLYKCRFCHDENEKHVLNRKNVTNIQCLKCKKTQEIKQVCVNCNVTFGRYFCAICKLFDDEDKKQYHCEGCGICRIGGKNNFFHCEKCDMCLPVKMKAHRCIENVSRADCPVCLEDLHTSRIPSHIPPCGHLVHKTCFEDMLKAGYYACPLCSESMVEMKGIWELMNAEISSKPMPEEYSNHYVWILCRDCHKDSRVKFHFLGLKCKHCGGYNTCQTRAPSPDADELPELNESDSSAVIVTNANSSVRENNLSAVTLNAEFSARGDSDSNLAMETSAYSPASETGLNGVTVTNENVDSEGIMCQ